MSVTEVRKMLPDDQEALLRLEARVTGYELTLPYHDEHLEAYVEANVKLARKRRELLELYDMENSEDAHVNFDTMCGVIVVEEA